jgi:hypothetical protein
VKALTLRQPWAEAICRGWKLIETRSWRAGAEFGGKRMLLQGAPPPPAACVVDGAPVARRGDARRDGLCPKCGAARNSHCHNAGDLALPLQKWIAQRRSGPTVGRPPRTRKVNGRAPAAEALAIAPPAPIEQREAHAPALAGSALVAIDEAGAKVVSRLLDDYLTATQWDVLPLLKKLEVARLVLDDGRSTQ